MPAKIWELLRRNYTFKKAVTRLIVLDGRVKQLTKEVAEFRNRGVKPSQSSTDSEMLSAKCRERSEAKFLASRIPDNVCKRHPFAAAALQWLVPEPWFEIRHTDIEAGVDLVGKQLVPPKLIKLESGSTASWHW